MNEARAGGQRTVHYVAAELCVAVAAKGGRRSVEDEYEAVRRGLNDTLTLAAANEEAFEASHFSADLRFGALKERLRRAGGGELLQALDRSRWAARTDAPPHGESGALPDRSFVLASSRDATESTALHFYQLAGTDGRGRGAGDDPVVRELVTFLNVSGAVGLAGEADAGPWRIVAATPNWLLAGAYEDETDGGPGAKPEPGDARSGRFRFTDSELAAQIAKGGGNGVVVAVLDTCPTKEQVRAAAGDGRGNWLLRSVAEHVEIDGPLSISRRYFSNRLPATAAQWRVPLPAPAGSDGQFEMPDHGLFAAGIIHSLVPQAEVHLIRVLGDNGSGDLLALTSTLSKLPAALLRDASGRENGKRLVVNMSLMASLPPGVSVEARSPRGDVPPSKEFLDFWLPATSAGKSEAELAALLAKPENAAVAASIKRTHVSLQHAVSALRGALLVGAAGNDALGRTSHPATRLPARYDDVLGVGAVRRNGQEARYSNRGDEQAMGDGIATFGGDARLAAPDAPPVVEGEWVTGVFSADQFPFGGGANRTGWARWAGTSFATPIISGIAASVWGSQPALTPPAVMQKVIDFRHGANATLACPWIQADQEP